MRDFPSVPSSEPRRQPALARPGSLLLTANAPSTLQTRWDTMTELCICARVLTELGGPERSAALHQSDSQRSLADPAQHFCSLEDASDAGALLPWTRTGVVA